MVLGQSLKLLQCLNVKTVMRRRKQPKQIILGSVSDCLLSRSFLDLLVLTKRRSVLEICANHKMNGCKKHLVISYGIMKISLTGLLA